MNADAAIQKSSGEQTEPSASACPRYPGFIIGLALSLILPSLVWILRDNSVWAWDQSWYGEVSIDLWRALVGPGSWTKAMLHAFVSKAPGIAWFGQFWAPVGKLIGSVEAGLLLSIIFWQAATLFLIHEVVSNLFGKKRLAITALLMCASAPLFIGLSHQYFVEPMQLFGITYFYWITLKSSEKSTASIISHLLIATSIAMLAKITSPLYCVCPGLLATWNTVRKFKRSKIFASSKRTWLFLSIAGLIFTAALAWYIQNGRQIFDFAQRASSGDLAAQFGTRNSFHEQLWYWLVSARRSFVLPSVIIVLVGLIAVSVADNFIGRRNFRVPGNSPLNSPFLVIAAIVQIVVVFVAFGFSVNRENRYLLPVLPSLVITTTWFLSLSRWRWVPVAAGCTFGLQWAVLHATTLGLYLPTSPNWEPRQNTYLNSDLGTASWLHRVQRNDDRKRELERLVEFTCLEKPQTPSALNMSGVSENWINGYTLSFYAAKLGLNSDYVTKYTGLGFRASDPEKVWERVKGVNPPYYVSLDQTKWNSQRSNQTSSPILNRIRENPAFVQMEFKSRFRIVVFRNNAAFTHETSNYTVKQAPFR